MLLAIADMEGRLQGKRLTAAHFLDQVLEAGSEGCSYLLTVDAEMETVGGYEMTSWDKGYGDFEMKPDAPSSSDRRIVSASSWADTTSNWPPSD